MQKPLRMIHNPGQNQGTAQVSSVRDQVTPRTNATNNPQPTQHHHHPRTSGISAISSQRVNKTHFSPFGRTNPTRARAPKSRQQKSPIDTLKPCVCPQASSAPKRFHPRRPTVTPLSGLRPPQGSQKAIIPRPSMRDRGSSSAWSI